MTRESLYLRAPRWLQATVVAGAGAYLDWQRLGGEFPALLAEANAAACASDAELRAIQERRWNARIRPAVAAVDAYGRRTLELRELDELPVLTKAEVRERAGAFVRRGYPWWRRVHAHTSGSTGAGLQFWLTRHAVRRNYAHVWRFRLSHGIQLGERCGVFGGRPVVAPDREDPPFWHVNPAGTTVLFSQYHLGPRTVRAYIDEIRRHRLRWLHGYPSVLALLAQLGVDAGLAGTTPVQWVTLSSETVLDYQRRAIAQMFGVAPRQHYAMSEAVALVSECPAGRLHVHEDYSVVEFLPVAGDPSVQRLVGTTLDNEAFPLLRYEVGDLVRLAGAVPCPCGRAGRIVSSIDGRQEDYLVLADGSRVGRSAFFKDAVHVRAAQIAQRKPGEATLRIIRAEGYGEADERALRGEIERRLGDRLTVTFEYVDQIPRTRAGKLRLVVSELPDGRGGAAASDAA